MCQDQPTEWLLDCLRAGATEEKTARLGRLSESDWRQVLDVAMRHYVAPLLYNRLKPLASRCNVPLGVLQNLRVVCVTNAARNMRIFRELGTVLTALRQAGIPIIVLKGAYLAEAVYPNIALRWMDDVDLLVPRAELPRAQAIVLDMGYGPRERRDIELICQRDGGLEPFVRGDSRVDIHWNVEDPISSSRDKIRIDNAGLWARARPATIADVHVLALVPEDLLLHLSLHISHHHGLDQGLRPYSDIVEAVRHFGGELDWRQFVDRTHEWGVSRYAGLSLYLARELLGATVPEDVLRRLMRRGPDSRMIEAATKCVLARKPYEPYRNDWGLLPFPNQWGDKSTRGKVNALRDAVFISRDEMASRYPGSRDSKHLWRYHVLRLVDLPRKYGRATLQQAFRMMRVHKRDSTPSLAKWLRSGKP